MQPSCAHQHRFHIANPAAERGTRLVMWITLAAMVVEIGAGWAFNSYALLADGWHMSSHALAIGLSAAAYAAARRHAADGRFAFGTWKIEILGGFASALFLLGVAALMVVGAVERLLQPQPIGYREAIVVAVLGLAVNVACALVLMRSGAHGHDHGHGHGHDGHGHAHHGDDHAGHDHGHADDGHGHRNGHGHAHAHVSEHAGDQDAAAARGVAAHQDLNLRAAYVHVVADALTSVLAIVALAGGWLFGWDWLDPAMGIVGAALVARWAARLLRDTGSVLLDREMHHPIVEEVRGTVKDAGAELTDLHVWRVGQRAYACAMTVATRDPALDAFALRARLEAHEEIVHSTIEVHHTA